MRNMVSDSSLLSFCFLKHRSNGSLGAIVRINPDEIHVKDTEWVGALYTGPTSVRTLHLLPLHLLSSSHL